LTLPLITNADGTKFGKTESGPSGSTETHQRLSLLPVLDQHRRPGRDPLPEILHVLSKEEIEALEKKHAENPGPREAHRALAKAVTDLIHGPNATTEAIRASEILFGGELKGIAEGTFNEIVGEVRRRKLKRRNWTALVCRWSSFWFTQACARQKASAKRHRRWRREREQRP